MRTDRELLERVIEALREIAYSAQDVVICDSKRYAIYKTASDALAFVDAHVKEPVQDERKAPADECQDARVTYDLFLAVEQILDDGHMNQEALARLRFAWEAQPPSQPNKDKP